MIAKRVVLIVALLTLVVSPFVLGTGVSAESDRPEVAECCRHLDETGELETADYTRGECLNDLKEAPSEHANNRIAAKCGRDLFEQVTGTTNKGQCIKRLR
jgi:hypothetical protein